MSGYSSVSSTGQYDNSYLVAHQNGYKVFASLSNCSISGSTQVNVSCSLSDITQNQKGANVSPSSIPFAWPYNDQQPSVELSLINQNGSWLINSDVNF